MSEIKILSETAEAVTLRRADFEALVRLAEDAEDMAAVWEARAAEALAGGHLKAKALAYTAEEAYRLLEGISPVRIWRERRGMTQRALAELAGLQTSYLCAIEGGQKPGSISAHLALSRALAVPMEFLAE